MNERRWEIFKRDLQRVIEKLQHRYDIDEDAAERMLCDCLGAPSVWAALCAESDRDLEYKKAFLNHVLMRRQR